MASTVYDPEICGSDVDGSVTKKENGPVRINRNSEHRWKFGLARMRKSSLHAKYIVILGLRTIYIETVKKHFMLCKSAFESEQGV